MYNMSSHQLHSTPSAGLPKDTFADDKVYDLLIDALESLPMKEVMTVVVKSAGTDEYSSAIDTLMAAAARKGVRLTLCEADGTAKFDSNKSAAFMKDPLNRGTPIHENFATRSVVRWALDSEEHIVDFEQKFSNSVGKQQTYAGVRIGLNKRKSIGAIRVSVNAYF